MQYTLENEYLSIQCRAKGAELSSIKNKTNGLEYLWQGNPTFWARQAPILFPIVGRLQNDSYTYRGKSYSMSQHGFARDQQFICTKQTDAQLIFELTSNAQTLAMYPFDFRLTVSYTINNNELLCLYHVENIGKEPMYFSIGAHPAFSIPLSSEGGYSDYSLEFSPKKARNIIPLEGPFADFSNKTVDQTQTAIQLQHQLFSNDALIFETPESTSISLQAEKYPEKITVSFENIPYVGIWSPYPKEAPFVCIEPWCGIADSLTCSGQLSEKIGIHCLAVDDIFEMSYSIAID